MSSSGQNPHYPSKGHAGKCHGKGVNGSGNPDERGGSEPKTTYIIGSSKSFEKTALRFQILLFFQTTDFLPPLL